MSNETTQQKYIRSLMPTVLFDENNLRDSMLELQTELNITISDEQVWDIAKEYNDMPIIGNCHAEVFANELGQYINQILSDENEVKTSMVNVLENEDTSHPLMNFIEEFNNKHNNGYHLYQDDIVNRAIANSINNNNFSNLENVTYRKDLFSYYINSIDTHFYLNNEEISSKNDIDKAIFDIAIEHGEVELNKATAEYICEQNLIEVINNTLSDNEWLSTLDDDFKKQVIKFNNELTNTIQNKDQFSISTMSEIAFKLFNQNDNVDIDIEDSFVEILNEGDYQLSKLNEPIKKALEQMPNFFNDYRKEFKFIVGHDLNKQNSSPSNKITG